MHQRVLVDYVESSFLVSVQKWPSLMKEVSLAACEIIIEHSSPKNRTRRPGGLL
ncbi:Uncharacterized protein APZ42_024031 [Daphnia magna]|uniref:Uncharacterized protein n=1 Tax=Daphnia magna TaxID=35525 RepID=A0A0P5YM28_9CRUS|nr:Uncharacterized protein APZ42_024031 [Daphnia magna]